MATLSIRFVFVILAMSGLCGCTSLPLTQAGTLSSYDRLGAQRGRGQKYRVFVDSVALLSLKTVAIEPTRFSASAASLIKSASDRKLVANAIDRALRIGLSDKYHVVSSAGSADLVVRTVVTNVVPTDRTMAGISTITSLGTSVVLPVGVPRLPFGIGGLATEAEAIDRSGVQRAATIWSREANSITNSARVSEVGDAYSLGSAFGNYFSRVLTTGEVEPGLRLSLPSQHRLVLAFGRKPRHTACETFGRAPGVAGVVASRIGAPPEWTDKGGISGEAMTDSAHAR